MDQILELFDLHWQTVIIALIDLAVMVFIVYFFLIRKMKKIMAGRKTKTEEVYNENTRLNQEVVDTRLKYETLTKEANEKITLLTKEATKAAEDKAQSIVDGAKKQASEIVAAAKKEMESERVRMEQYFKTQITSLAVDVAAKVLEREVKEQDNSRIIDEALNKWSN